MKIPRQAYTQEFKELAVGRVKLGQSIAGTARELGLVEQTLRNWVKAAAKGMLTGAGKATVSAEQMEITRLKSELIRTQRELEILKKAAAYFAKDAL
jgi:transposase